MKRAASAAGFFVPLLPLLFLPLILLHSFAVPAQAAIASASPFEIPLAYTTNDLFIFGDVMSPFVGFTLGDNHMLRRVTIEIENPQPGDLFDCPRCALNELVLSCIDSPTQCELHRANGSDFSVTELIDTLQTLELDFETFELATEPRFISYHVADPLIYQPPNRHRMRTSDAYYAVVSPAMTYAEATVGCAAKQLYGRTGRVLPVPPDLPVVPRFWIETVVQGNLITTAEAGLVLYNLSSQQASLPLSLGNGSSCLLVPSGPTTSSPEHPGVVIDRSQCTFAQAPPNSVTAAVICAFEPDPDGNVTSQAMYPLRARVRFDMLKHDGRERPQLWRMPDAVHRRSAGGELPLPVEGGGIDAICDFPPQFFDETHYFSVGPVKVCVAVDFNSGVTSFRPAQSTGNWTEILSGPTSSYSVGGIHRRHGDQTLLLAFADGADVFVLTTFTFDPVSGGVSAAVVEIDANALDGSPTSDTPLAGTWDLTVVQNMLIIGYMNPSLHFISRWLNASQQFTYRGSFGFNEFLPPSSAVLFDVPGGNAIFMLRPNQTTFSVSQGSVSVSALGLPNITWSPAPPAIIISDVGEFQWAMYTNGVLDICAGHSQNARLLGGWNDRYYSYTWLSRTAGVSNPVDAGTTRGGCWFYQHHDPIGRSFVATSGSIVSSVFAATTGFGTYDQGGALQGRYCVPLPWRTQSKDDFVDKAMCFSLVGGSLVAAGGALEFPTAPVYPTANRTMLSFTGGLLGGVSANRELVVLLDSYSTGSVVLVYTPEMPDSTVVEGLGLSLITSGIRLAPLVESELTAHIFSISAPVSLSAGSQLQHHVIFQQQVLSAPTIHFSLPLGEVAVGAWAIQTGHCTAQIFVVDTAGRNYQLVLQFCDATSTGFRPTTSGFGAYVPHVKILSINQLSLARQHNTTAPYLVGAHLGNGEVFSCFRSGQDLVAFRFQPTGSHTFISAEPFGVTTCAALFQPFVGSPRFVREEWRYYSHPMMCAHECEQTSGCRSWLLTQAHSSMNWDDPLRLSERQRCLLYSNDWAAEFRSHHAFAFGTVSDIGTVDHFGTSLTTQSATKVISVLTLGKDPTLDSCIAEAAGAPYSFTPSVMNPANTWYANFTPGAAHICPDWFSAPQCPQGTPCCKIVTNTSMCTADYSDPAGITGNLNGSPPANVHPRNRMNLSCVPSSSLVLPDGKGASSGHNCTSDASVDPVAVWTHNGGTNNASNLFSTVGWNAVTSQGTYTVQNAPGFTIFIANPSGPLTGLQFRFNASNESRATVFVSVDGIDWRLRVFNVSTQNRLNMFSLFDGLATTAKWVRVLFTGFIGATSFNIGSLAVYSAAKDTRQKIPLLAVPRQRGQSCMLSGMSLPDPMAQQYYTFERGFTSLTECHRQCCGFPYCARVSMDNDPASSCGMDGVTNQLPAFVGQSDVPAVSHAFSTCTLVTEGARPGLPGNASIGCYQIPSIVSCARYCCANPHCVTWAYSSSLQECTFYSASSSEESVVTDSGFAFGSKVVIPSLVEETYATQLWQVGFAEQGNSEVVQLQSIAVAGIDATYAFCNVQCADASPCNAFTFTFMSDGGNGEAIGVSYCTLYLLNVSTIDLRLLVDDGLLRSSLKSSSGILGATNTENLTEPIFENSFEGQYLRCGESTTAPGETEVPPSTTEAPTTPPPTTPPPTTPPPTTPPPTTPPPTTPPPTTPPPTTPPPTTPPPTTPPPVTPVPPSFEETVEMFVFLLNASEFNFTAIRTALSTATGGAVSANQITLPNITAQLPAIIITMGINGTATDAQRIVDAINTLPAALQQLGVRAAKRPSEAAVAPSITAFPPSRTVCVDTVQVEAARDPITAAALWASSSATVLINQPQSDTTVVSRLPVGNTNISLAVYHFRLQATRSMTITRVPPINATAGPSQAPATNSVQMAATLPAGAVGQWTVLEGNGIVVNSSNPASIAEGTGVVQFQWAVTTALCGSAFYFATITFPERPSCDPVVDCNNNGVCSADGDNSCACFRTAALGFFSGLQCERCLTGYTGYPSCTQRAACVNGTASCVNGECTADGSRCVCHRDATRGYWVGQACDTCEQSSGGGFWSGDRCNVCLLRFYPAPGGGIAGALAPCTIFCDGASSCSGNGQCDSSGQCVCNRNSLQGFWVGAQCTQCIAPYFGPSCTLMCSAATSCSGHGACLADGRCECFNDPARGYWASTDADDRLRPDCDICTTGFFGVSCTQRITNCTSANCINGDCNNDGLCICWRNATAGVWAGSRCDRCMSNAVDGFWVGTRCTSCATGYWGPTCTSLCPSNCSGHGTCSTVSNGQCVCDNSFSRGFWAGDAICSTCSAGFHGARCLARCLRGENCFSGVCTPEGVCMCFANTTAGFWVGPTCSRCLSTQTRSYTGASCTNCSANYYGPNCDRFCSAFETCSGNGVCGTDGSCQCFADATRGFWAGERCNTCQAGKAFPDCRTDIVQRDTTACVLQFNVTAANATFDSTFTTVEVFLSAPGDRGAEFRAANPSIADGSCMAYFSPSTIVKLGGGATCQWRTSAMLIVSLGTGSTLLVQDLLQLFVGSIVGIDPATGDTRCGNINPAASLSVGLPAEIRPPRAVLVARTEIGSCEGVILDATRSVRTSPRTSFGFSVLDNDASAALRGFLAQLPTDAAQASIPAGFIPAGTWRFRVVLLDEFTGFTSSASTTVTKLATAPPVINYRGESTVQYAGAEGTRLVVDAAFTPCASTSRSRALQFSWVLNPLPVLEAGPLNLQAATLVIPRMALRTEIPHTANITVTEVIGGVITNESLSATRSITLLPRASPLTTRFIGTVGRVSRLNPLTITMDCSDPDSSSRRLTDIIATWACTGPACTPNVQQLLQSAANATLSLPGGWTTSTGDVTITATCALHGKTASDSLMLTINELRIPVVRVTAPLVVRSTDRIPIAVTVGGAIQPAFRWSCVAPCVADLADRSVSPLGATSRNLVVLAASLPSGTSHTFRINVTDVADADSRPAIAEATVRVLRGPSGGSLSVDRTIVTSFERIGLAARNWVTDDENYPLEYAIAYVSERGSTTQLSAFSPRTEAAIRATKIDSAEVFSFVLTVRDRSGSTATVSTHIMAVEDSEEIDGVAALAGDARLALSQGRNDEVLSTFVSMATGISSDTDEDTVDLLLTSISPQASNIEQLSSITAGVSNNPLNSRQLGDVLNVSRQIASFVTRESRQVGENIFRTVGRSASMGSLLNSSNPSTRRRAAAESEVNARQAVETAELAGDLTIALSGGALDGETLSVANRDLELGCLRLASGETEQASSTAGGSTIVASDLSNTTAAESLDLCVLQYNSNLYAGLDPNTTLGAPLVAFDVNDDTGTRVRIDGPPMVFTLPRDPETAEDEAECVWFDRENLIYRNDGCTVLSANATTVVCQCTHLTEFTVRVNKVDIGNFEDIKTGGIVLVSIIGGLLLGLLIFGFILDQLRQRRYKVAKYVAAAQASAVDDSISFTADALCSRQRTQVRAKLLTGWPLFFWTLRQNHPWLSPFFGHPAASITAPQRVAVLFVSIIVSLFANGLTFQGGDDERLEGGQVVVQTFFAILISVSMGFAATRFVQFFFDHTPRSPYDQANTFQPTEEEIADAAKFADQSNPFGRSQSLVRSRNESEKSPASSTCAPAGLIPRKELMSALERSSSSSAQFKAAEVISTVLSARKGKPVVLPEQTVVQATLSLDMRRRHLAALSLQALTLADSLKGRATLKGTSALDFVREVSRLLGMPCNERASAADATAVAVTESSDAMELVEVDGNIVPEVYTTRQSASRASDDDGVSHEALVISCALQNYLCAAALSPNCTMPRCEIKRTDIADDLYGTEMHGVVWRMAIECVRLRQMVLAEALFAMHLLLENPDLYFVLYHVPRPETLEEILATVLACANSYESLADPFDEESGANVPRLWASFYASYILRLDGAAYKVAHAASDLPSINTLIALLDLTPGKPVLEYGCVSYSLSIEHEVRTPSLSTCVESITSGRFESFVLAAHAFRLATKPNVDQRWRMSLKERIDIATCRWSQLPVHCQTAVEDANKELSGKQFNSVNFMPPHGGATIRDVIRAIRRLKTVSKHQSARSLLSSARYNPGEMDGTIDVPRVLVPFLNDRLKSLLLSVNVSHHNVYSTIEFGRLFAMVTAMEENVCSMAEFGDRYVRELGDLGLRHRDKHLRLVDEGQWVTAVSETHREASQEISGNNIIPSLFMDASDPVLVAGINIASNTMNAQSATQRRHAIAAVDPSRKPLTILAKFHPVACMGTGSMECPHIGITSAVAASFLGDQIALSAGRYLPVVIANCQGTIKHEVVVAPEGYFEAFEHQAPQRPLTEDERSRIADVSIAFHQGTSTKEEKKPLVRFSESSHIRIAGVKLDGAKVAAQSNNSPECIITHSIVNCEAPYSSNGSTTIASVTNEITATAPKVKQILISKSLPWPFIIVGHFFAIGLFLLFTFLTLFLTADYSESKANIWVIRSVTTIVIIAVIVNPLFIGGLSQFVLLSNVILSLESAF